MSKLFLTIPHVYPNLEIACDTESVMDYISNTFTPYISTEADESKDYKKLIIYKNELEQLIVEGDDWRERIKERIFSYLQRYLLENSYTESGYLWLHGGCVVRDNKAIILLGNSGVGKSTLITYLCLNGFEYVTDDRVIVDVHNREVIPFPKTIMLRAGGKELLTKHYGCILETRQYQQGKIQREFFKPEVCRKENAKIIQICFLRREEGCRLSRSIVQGQELLKELLGYSLSVQDCRKISEFFKLCNVTAERVCFSDLNEMKQWLQEMYVY